MSYKVKKFDNRNGQGFYYYEYLPENYGKENLPLVVFLHGAGEAGNADGTEIEKVNRYGFGKKIKREKEYPFAFVSPQCPRNKYWGCYIESLNLFLDHVIRDLKVDPKRVYLTGLSMGGTGTWLWSIANPERFAAVVPVCGTGV